MKKQFIYTAPACELNEEVFEEILCASNDGITENFDNLDDFTW